MKARLILMLKNFQRISLARQFGFGVVVPVLCCVAFANGLLMVYMHRDTSISLGESLALILEYNVGLAVPVATGLSLSAAIFWIVVPLIRRSHQHTRSDPPL